MQNGVSVFESTGWKGCSMSRARCAPRSISDAKVEAVITQTLESMCPPTARTGARG